MEMAMGNYAQGQMVMMMGQAEMNMGNMEMNMGMN